MSINTQNIEIFEEGNPLKSRKVTVAVKNNCKILSHEPYVAEAIKMYDLYCPSDVISNIASYEDGTFKAVREGTVSYVNEETNTAAIELSGKHTVSVSINKNERVDVGSKIDVVVSRKKGKITADASSKSAQIERMKQELLKQIQSPTSAYVGCVKQIVYNGSNTFNGFIVDVGGLNCFMPRKRLVHRLLVRFHQLSTLVYSF